MLSVLLKRLKCSHWYALKQFTQCRPEEVEWLKHKYEANKHLTPRMQYLTGLQSQGRLEVFYKNKPIQQIEDYEFYYLLNSSVPFNLARKTKSELLAKLQSTFFKCLLYKEFKIIEELEQVIIMLSFNEQLSNMEAYEICFCLEVISRFTPVVKEQIDRTALSTAIQRYQLVPQHAHCMLVIGGYLSDLFENCSELITPQTLQFWAQHNKKWDFRAICFLYKLSKKIDYTIQPAIRHLLDLKMSQAFLNLEMIHFESDYIVFLLEYYPQYLNRVNILNFSPQAYLGYLQFYKNKPNIKLKPHRIPRSVIQLTSTDTFKQILQLRRVLQLETTLSIAKSFEDFINENLLPIKAVINMLHQQNAYDLQVEFMLEKALENKLKFAEFHPELLEHYNPKMIVQLLVSLARKTWGTIDFWKRATRWFDKFIEYNNEKNIVQCNLQMAVKFVALVSRKTVKTATKQLVMQFAKGALQNLEIYVTLEKLRNFSNALLSGKIGEQELWLLIEGRCIPLLEKLEKRKISSEQRRHDVITLSLAFAQMRKGSYKFWKKLDSILDEKQKTFVLKKVIDPKSPVHFYFKTNVEQL